MNLFYDQSGTEIWNTPFVEILFLFGLAVTLTEYGQNDYNNKEVVNLLNKRLDIVESKLDLILSKIEELEDIDYNSFLEVSEIQTGTENVSVNTISSDIENEIEEPSMLDDINAETSLVEVKESETSFLVSPRSLNKFYILKKRIKLAFYKLFTAIPKIIGSAFDEGKN